MLGVGTALAPAKFVMYGYREGIEETGNKNIWPCWQNSDWNSERIWLLNYLLIVNRLQLEKLKNTKDKVQKMEICWNFVREAEFLINC